MRRPTLCVEVAPPLLGVRLRVESSTNFERPVVTLADEPVQPDWRRSHLTWQHYELGDSARAIRPEPATPYVVFADDDCTTYFATRHAPRNLPRTVVVHRNNSRERLITSSWAASSRDLRELRQALDSSHRSTESLPRTPPVLSIDLPAHYRLKVNAPYLVTEPIDAPIDLTLSAASGRVDVESSNRLRTMSAFGTVRIGKGCDNVNIFTTHGDVYLNAPALPPTGPGLTGIIATRTGRVRGTASPGDCLTIDVGRGTAWITVPTMVDPTAPSRFACRGDVSLIDSHDNPLRHGRLPAMQQASACARAFGVDLHGVGAIIGNATHQLAAAWGLKRTFQTPRRGSSRHL